MGETGKTTIDDFIFPSIWTPPCLLVKGPYAWLLTTSSRWSIVNWGFHIVAKITAGLQWWVVLRKEWTLLIGMFRKFYFLILFKHELTLSLMCWSILCIRKEGKGIWHKEEKVKHALSSNDHYNKNQCFFTPNDISH